MDKKESIGEIRRRRKVESEKISEETNGDCEKLRDDRNQEIIALLHEYNNVKDATQIVLGALANLEGVTVKDIHLKYGLPLES